MPNSFNSRFAKSFILLVPLMASFAPSRNFYPTTLENDSVQFCHFHTNQSLEGFAKIDIFLLFAIALLKFHCRKTIHSRDEYKGHDISCAQIFTFYVRFYANGGGTTASHNQARRLRHGRCAGLDGAARSTPGRCPANDEV